MKNTLLSQKKMHRRAIAAFVIHCVFILFATSGWAQFPPLVPTPTITVTPTPTPTVTPTPSTTSMGPAATAAPNPTPTVAPHNNEPAFHALDSNFQAFGTGNPQNGQILDWVEYQPSGLGIDGGSRWPVVVILHIGGFKDGSFYDNFHNAPQDLNAAGYYVIVADWPLAPPHSIQGQNDQMADIHSGRPPQQTRSIEAVIRAAAASNHCYHGLVGVLGGSSGAGHAAFTALDVRSDLSTWPNWGFSQRPKCVVCLSGQYDLAERDADTAHDMSAHFIGDIENYTNSTRPSDQYAASPVSLVTPLVISGNSLVPMYFFRSNDDPGSPKSTSYYLWNALTQPGYDQSLFRMWDVPPSSNMDHAFALWDDPTYDTYPVTSITVRDRAIGFFKRYLRD